MCILLCFIEYNEKSRLGTTYPDELFKNAVAAVYKAAAAAATRPLFLFFFFFSYTSLFFITMCIYATYVKIYRCRVESTSGVVKRTVFSPHKEVGTPIHTLRALLYIIVVVYITHTHTQPYVFVFVCVSRLHKKSSG